MKRQHAMTLALAVAGWAMPLPARGDEPKPNDKAACADAYSQAQTFRETHKLAEARAQLLVCAQSICPGFIVKDCASWLADTEARLPSVVLTAKDGAGNALVDISVLLDGAPSRTKLDGESLDVDPGAHTFTFVAKDGTKVDRQVVVQEGQKAQSVLATFAGPSPSEAAVMGPVTGEGSVSPSSQPTAPPAYWTGQRLASAVTAGAGLVGLVVGGVFGGMTFSEVSQQNSDCGSGAVCAHISQAQADHTSALTDGTVSTVGLIAGGALVAGGAALFFTGGSKAASTSTGLLVVPSVGPGRGGVLLRMEF